MLSIPEMKDRYYLIPLRDGVEGSQLTGAAEACGNAAASDEGAAIFARAAA